MENQDDPVDDDLLPWEGQKSEGDDDFSSCGESEFERYCSANSAIGTPSSVCSSSVYEFADSEFGPSSFDSFRLGGGRKNLKNYVADSKLLHISDASTSTCSRIAKSDGNDKEIERVDSYGCPDTLMSDCEVVFAGNGVRSLGKNRGGAVGDGSSCENEGVRENVNLDELNCENKMGSSSRDLGRLYLHPGIEFDVNDADKCSDEYEALSRDGLSEFDDDSMSGGVLEDGRNFSMNREDIFGNSTHAKNENGLFMSAGAAFGLDDWDDFMQATSESPLDMILQDEFLSKKQQCPDVEIGCHGSVTATGISGIASKERDEVLNVSRSSCHIQGKSESGQPVDASLPKMEFGEPGEQSAKEKHLRGVDEFTGNLETEFEFGNYEMDQNLEREGITSDAITDIDKGNGHKDALEGTGVSFNLVREQVELGKTNVMGNPLSNVSKPCSVESIVELKSKVFKENDPSSMRLLSNKNPGGIVENSQVLLHHFDDHFSPVKKENSEANVSFDDMVHEMEEILLDSGRSPGSRFINGRFRHQPQIPFPSRDGGSTASTSGTDEVYTHQLPPRFTGVEVIGARQKEGDVSFSERLVGVKKYSVYRIRVSIGEENWEVERRYRDFYALYHQLKKLFQDQDLVLPLPWSSVERESRKLFGNASPDVVAERSILIQECLQSVIHLEISSSSFYALIRFLSPSKANISSPSTPLSDSPHSSRGTETQNESVMGSTVSLIVQLRPYKSVKQLLEAQHYTCAGCHRSFDVGKTRMKELVQTLGWGKPRFCEYSGQLFCSACHNNDTAVLPARVLQRWDFTHYPVSQLSKSYLDSIFDKPMLCVSAVNPHLFSRVPTLQHVRNVRKKIGDMLPFVRCSFRRAIQKGLGSRRYLLESNDFFALRDLIDLSKGMFAALPGNVEIVSKTIREHITEQCLICCDSGIPCNAKQACNDPSALIFPFQEEEVEKCKSCMSVFHKHCFGRMVTCYCGAHLKPIGAKGLASNTGRTLIPAREDADPNSGFLSVLLSKVMAPRPVIEKESPKHSNSTVILMSSLPNTSL